MLLSERTERFRRVEFALDPPDGDIGLRRKVDRFPFVPDDPRLAQDCYEAYNIQVSGLEQRLRAIGRPKVVIGVSGGLDSTHALIVAAKAMDRLGRPRSDILVLHDARASRRARAPRTTPRADGGARRHLRGARHPPGRAADAARPRPPVRRGEPVYDVTFENVQAGLRTDYLFRLANQRGGIVLGTGDLSELALGWCTYGVGDQMSHYNVNAGVPKTLIQHLIRWVIATRAVRRRGRHDARRDPRHRRSPPSSSRRRGRAVQSTEDKIGPYALQDFTLFHVLRYGFRPSKIAFLAWHAWHDADAGQLAAGLPRRAAPRVRPGRRSGTGSRSSCSGSSLQPVQALGAAERARRSAPAARCRRAATGGRRRTARATAWLAEIAAPERLTTGVNSVPATRLGARRCQLSVLSPTTRGPEEGLDAVGAVMSRAAPPHGPCQMHGDEVTPPSLYGPPAQVTGRAPAARCASPTCVS